VVLDRRTDPDVAVRNERLDGELLADEAFFEDDAVVVRASEVLLGLLLGHLVAGDLDTLAAGEASRA